jgi:hypothetical protein
MPPRQGPLIPKRPRRHRRRLSRERAFPQARPVAEPKGAGLWNRRWSVPARPRGELAPAAGSRPNAPRVDPSNPSSEHRRSATTPLRWLRTQTRRGSARVAADRPARPAEPWRAFRRRYAHALTAEAAQAPRQWWPASNPPAPSAAPWSRARAARPPAGRRPAGPLQSFRAFRRSFSARRDRPARRPARRRKGRARRRPHDRGRAFRSAREGGRARRRAAAFPAGARTSARATEHHG